MRTILCAPFALQNHEERPLTLPRLLPHGHRNPQCFPHYCNLKSARSQNSVRGWNRLAVPGNRNTAGPPPQSGWRSNLLCLSSLSAMEFHEHLHSIGTKEGLKERKLQKAVESFTWNITILKVSSESFLVPVTLRAFSACFFLSVSHGLCCRYQPPQAAPAQRNPVPGALRACVSFLYSRKGFFPSSVFHRLKLS